MSTDEQEIVLTPMRSGVAGGHVMRIERTSLSHLNKANVQHFAGGPFKGIVINKASENDKPEESGWDTYRSFTAYIADQKKEGSDKQEFIRERRNIRFWFEDMAKVTLTVTAAITDTFMKELLNPDEFPKDYITFVKRVLTLVRQYHAIQKVELIIKPMSDTDEDDELVLRKRATLERSNALNSSTTSAGVGQEDFRRLADGTLVDSHGQIVHEGSSAKMNGSAAMLRPKRKGDGDDDVTNGDIKGQEDFRRLADGTLVDAHGQIVSEDQLSMRQNGDVSIRRKKTETSTDEDGVTITKTTVTKTTKTTVGASQEDYRRLADGTLVDSHGNIVHEDSGSMQTKDGILRKKDALDASNTSNDGDMSMQSFDRTDELFNTSHSPERLSGVVSSDIRRSDVYKETFIWQVSQDESKQEKSSEKSSEIKRQPTITRRGWDMVWATKKQKLLNILEDAYPNVLSVNNLVKESGYKSEDVEYLMSDLQMKGMIKEIGTKRWIRMQQERKLTIKKPRNSRSSRTSMDLSIDEGHKGKHDFKMVTHVPRLDRNEQPTIAIITLLYCEKLAVDAMMDFKTTYIRIKKTEGEGLVYTVGKIGGHRVVATKLPRIGHGQGATVSAGNSITRLLGTFGYIEHVILVGVGGGVCNLKDESRHVRLGDIVISKSSDGEPAYIHLRDNVNDDETDIISNIKTWSTNDDLIPKIVSEIHSDFTKNTFFGADWEQYVKEAEKELKGSDLRVFRPAAETDKLYHVQDDKEIDIDHPMSPSGTFREQYPDRPVLHLGPIGTGRLLSKENQIREEFAEKYHVLCIDSGFHAVMDSIEGNRKDSFVIIRGISDYQDGAQRREWQAYASLVAAAVMKSILMEIPWEEESDDDN